MLSMLLADGVVAVHFLWILFLIFGGFWGRGHRRVRLVHIPALTAAFFIGLLDWYCPLTYLEVWLRRRQGTGIDYAGSFIARYIERIVYLDVDRRLIVVLTLALCGFNFGLYAVGRRKTRE